MRYAHCRKRTITRDVLININVLLFVYFPLLSVQRLALFPTISSKMVVLFKDCLILFYKVFVENNNYKNTSPNLAKVPLIY